jgi:hypothetical protein
MIMQEGDRIAESRGRVYTFDIWGVGKGSKLTIDTRVPRNCKGKENTVKRKPD